MYIFADCIFLAEYGNRKTEPGTPFYGVGESGEEVLNERSEFRNLTPIPRTRTKVSKIYFWDQAENDDSIHRFPYSAY